MHGGHPNQDEVTPTCSRCADQVDSDYFHRARPSAREATAAMPAYERAADILDRRAAEIGPLSARESGKAIRETRAEVPRAASILRMYAEEAIRIPDEHSVACNG